MKLVLWSAVLVTVLVIVGGYVDPLRHRPRPGRRHRPGHGMRHPGGDRAYPGDEWDQAPGRPERNRHHRGPGRGPHRGPDRGPDRGPGRGPDRGPRRGPGLGPGLGLGDGLGPGRGRGLHRGPGRGHGRHHQGTEAEPHGHGHRSRWSEMLPEWAAPWLRGRIQLGKGSPLVNVDWDIATFFNREQRQWWKGPNVCINRKNEEENSQDGGQISRHRVITSSKCDETDTAYRCTTTLDIYGKRKTFTVTYECCHGFQREKGKSGCTKELDLKDVVATMQDLGAKEMAKALESMQLTKRLLESNYTIFAPTDAALKKFLPSSGDVNKNVIVIDTDNNMVTKMKELLTAHAVPGIVKTSSMRDEQLLATANPNAKIRINIYERPKKLLTANCGKVLSSDQIARQGVVHVVDKVLTPLENTIIDLISKDRSLTTFKTMLGKAGIAKMLREEGDLTVFAPTDAAFAKLKPSMKEKLLRGQACLNNVLKNHVLPNVICSSIIEGKVKTKNVLDQYVNMSRSTDNKLFVGNAQLVTRDSMATNGVLHIIDNVLIPTEALDVLDTAEKVGASKFIQLVSAAKLNKTFQTLSNFTLFLPTDAAIESMPEKEREKLMKNPEALSKMLKYHVIKGSQRQCRYLKNDQQFATLDSNKKIRIKEYSSFPFGLKWQKTAQCAPMTRTDIKTCTGMIHLVDKVLIPPQGDLLVTLSLAGNFSRLIGLLKKSGVADQLTGKGPFTFFAPTDQALEALDAETLKELSKDNDKLTKVLKHHIMKDVLCCSGIFKTKWLWKIHERTLDGDSVSINRNNDVVLVDDVPIRQCDLTATDGVVHVIDQVLPKAIKKHTESHKKRPLWADIDLPERNSRRGSHRRNWETDLDVWDDDFDDRK